MNKDNQTRNHHEKKKEAYTPKISPDAPATEKQRALLRLAIAKNWLTPNPFENNHTKWEGLKAGEADKLLASIPPERLGILERELNKQKMNFDTRGMGRGMARGSEDILRQIGHAIDGGM